uniref:7TM GPCR serpentine receptor class x (Srx) domain-containing protein n=1 Tax=Panagrellus redivivus TaxID=6233 RepID=A0A7E4V0T2_PANRE
MQKKREQHEKDNVHLSRKRPPTSRRSLRPPLLSEQNSINNEIHLNFKNSQPGAISRLKNTPINIHQCIILVAIISFLNIAGLAAIATVSQTRKNVFIPKFTNEIKSCRDYYRVHMYLLLLLTNYYHPRKKPDLSTIFTCYCCMAQIEYFLFIFVLFEIIKRKI